MNEKYQKIDFIKQKYSKHSKFEISRKIWKCHLLARSVTFWHKGDTWGVTFYNYIITDILRFSSKRWRFLQFFSDLCLPIKIFVYPNRRLVWFNCSQAQKWHSMFHCKFRTCRISVWFFVYSLRSQWHSMFQCKFRTSRISMWFFVYFISFGLRVSLPLYLVGSLQ